MDNRKFVYSEKMEESDVNGGICIVEKTDDGEEIVEEISEATAHDASGEPVKSYYRIDGDSLIQGIELTEGIVYPITIE